MTKKAELLLKKLVNDYHTSLPKKLNVNSRSTYIYNLFMGKYKFSFETYDEIFEYLCELSNENKNILKE